MAETTAAEADELFAEAHGPDRGPWHYALYLLFRAALWALTWAPWWAVRGTVEGLAAVAHRFDRRHSAAARDFLRTAYPDLAGPELERRVRQAYRHFLLVIVESQRLLERVPPAELPAHFRYDFAPGVRELLEQRRGVVLASGHVGNWEAGTIAMSVFGSHRFHGVAKPVKNHYISRFVLDRRSARGVEILPRRGAMTVAPRIVAEGHMLGLLLDQRARVKPVLAPFFGRPARCDRSVGVLLRRLGVPVVFCACYRTERPLHFRFVAGPVLSAEEVAGLSPVEVSTRVNRELERMIRAAPDQYFWLHDRYRDAPPPAGDPAPGGGVGAPDPSRPGDAPHA